MWLTLTSAVVVPHLCVLLQLTDYSSQIRSYVFDVVRATVPKIILDDVFVVSGSCDSAHAHFVTVDTQVTWQWLDMCRHAW
jgi:hypothetical protein